MSNRQIVIGKNVETGQDVLMDLEKLMDGGLAILANSGGGKTNEIKVICEATHSDVLGSDALQHIILDWEGDIVTLAEKFDYLVAERIEAGEEGKKKRIHADPKNAALMARKTLELNLNLIVDLSSMPLDKRRLFVKNFLEALVYTPKELWNRQCIVVIDEAHELAPEKGMGDPLALPAVVDLMSLGRKRGLRGILASQRPARLAKDALSQTRNKMIGLASWDTDQKSLAKELGWTTLKEQKRLEELDYEFYVVGPAISKKLIKIKTPVAKSRALKPGKITDFKPMETGRAVQMLGEFKDLAVKADEELRTIDDYKRKNSELVRKNAQLEYQLKQQKPAMDPATIQQAEQRGYAKAKEEMKIAVGKLTKMVYDAGDKLTAIAGNLNIAEMDVSKAHTECLKILDSLGETVILSSTPVSIPKPIPNHTGPPAEPKPMPLITASEPRPLSEPMDSNGKPLNAGKKKILEFLLLRVGAWFTRQQLGAMSGFAPGSGTFGTYLSELKTEGWIQQSPDRNSFTANPDRLNEAMAQVGDSLATPMTVAQRIEEYAQKNLAEGALRIYKVLKENPTLEFDREILANASGFKDGKSGTFGTYLSNLHTLGLIKKLADNRIAYNADLLTL